MSTKKTTPPADTKVGNSIPKSSMTSSVTSDLPEGHEPQIDATPDAPGAVDNSADEIVEPGSEFEGPTPGEDITEEAAKQNEINASAEMRMLDAGLGLVKVDGIDLRYVGVAPARDKDAKTPGGLPITPENSTFLPLGNVPFHPSIKIKDPASGEFYYPQDGVTSWDACMYKGNRLVPEEASPEGIESRTPPTEETPTAETETAIDETETKSGSKSDKAE